MRATSLFLPAVALAWVAFATMLAAKNDTSSEDTSPIFGVTIPEEYRHWELIAPAQEGEPFDELRTVLGNELAIKTYRAATLPFPDGTVLAKLAWKRVRSPEFESAAVPGAPTSLQFMVKDSQRYAATGGWGFGKFVDGKVADEPQHHACFACHDARVKGHDFVFTRFAP